MNSTWSQKQRFKLFNINTKICPNKWI